MKSEIREAVYDRDLEVEAYRLRGVVQPFPNHFHGHYVIGLVEDGERVLSCKGRTYTVGQGSVLLFSPGDSHGCVQSDGGTLDYRGLTISREAMLDWTEAAGRRTLPAFFPNAVRDEEIAGLLRLLHEQIMGGGERRGKEPALLLLLSGLIRRYGQPDTADCPREVERARAFMEAHCAERISLDQICRHAGLSQSSLLRTFSRACGVTPYRYLESVRIDRAKGLLARGVSLPETALRMGFADQSHFTNYFTSFTGLSPGAYRDIFRGGEVHEEE